MAANTRAAAASESVLLVTKELQICLQFDREGVRGVEVCLQTRACRVGGSYHSTPSPLQSYWGEDPIGGPVGPPGKDGPQVQVVGQNPSCPRVRFSPDIRSYIQIDLQAYVYS